PPSRLSWHAPWHADGELYWFITKGVNGTDMPAFEQALTDEERWAIVHFLRTLPREGPIWFPGARMYGRDKAPEIAHHTVRRREGRVGAERMTAACGRKPAGKWRRWPPSRGSWCWATPCCFPSFPPSGRSWS